MSSAVERRRYTPEEYLALERRAESRSEYLDGEIFAMAGGSREHNHIAGNLYRLVSTQLADRPCEAFIFEMRVRVVPTGLYTYPDVVAVCGEPHFEDDGVDTLLNPTLIIEVLSPSSESYDRGKKFGQYRRLASLREYVLASQDRMLIERYTRQGDDWVLSEYRRRADVVRLESIGCEFSLVEAYAKVDAPEDGSDLEEGATG